MMYPVLTGSVEDEFNNPWQFRTEFIVEPELINRAINVPMEKGDSWMEKEAKRKNEQVDKYSKDRPPTCRYQVVGLR